MRISPWKKSIGVSQEIWKVDFLHDDQRSDPGFEASCGTHTREWCQLPTSTSCWEANSLSRLSSRWNTIGSLVPHMRLAGPIAVIVPDALMAHLEVGECLWNSTVATYLQTSWHTAAMSRVTTENSDAGGDIWLPRLVSHPFWQLGQ